MKRTYSLFQQYIASTLLISLCLQSCGGGFDNNPLIPIQEEQIASIPTNAQAILLPTNIQPLIGQELIAQGGHSISFYAQGGELKADVAMNAPQGFSKSYEGVKVYVEQGTELASLHRLDIKAQERRIHLQLAKGNQPAKVVIYKGAGLMGGMLEGEEEATEDEQEDKDIPHECFCPITQEIMEDPVIALDGYTYERMAIQEWFDRGKRTSPKTGARLLSIELTPNYSMRSLIQDLKAQIPVLARHKLDMHHIEAAIKLREEEVEETLAQKGQLIEKENKEKLNLAVSLEQKEKELEEKIDLVDVMKQRIRALEGQVNSSKLREEEIAEKLVQKNHLVEKESQEKLHLAAALEQRERELAKRTAVLKLMDDRIRELERQVRYFLEKDNKTHSIMLQIQQCMGQLSSEQFMSSSSGSSSSSSFIADSKDNTTVLAANQLKDKGKEKLKDEDYNEAKAQFNLGEAYYYGQEVEKDYIKAKEWFKKGAEKGDVNAQVNLGLMYEQGKGMKANYKRAISCYQAAIEKGSPIAQASLARMYFSGKGIEKDIQQASALLHVVNEEIQAGAERGNIECQFMLGWMYKNGQGVERDYTKAKEYYERAASQGHAWAQNNLGSMYYYGQGVEQDYTKAKEWYQRAADQGYAWAQNNLGGMYAHGKGIAQCILSKRVL
jgi:TPR repeat protein/CII-binding regulator of phage lambda lysogenization HflD